MTGPDGPVQVRLLGVPLVLRERSQQQGADLLREMTLLRAGQSPDPDVDVIPSRPGDHAERGEAVGTSRGAGRMRTGEHVPGRLLELAQELEQVYGPYVAAGNEQMDQALDRGQAALDVTYQLPPEAATFVARVRTLLAEVEQYCASDDYLLTLTPPPDIAAYRDWSTEQVLLQAAGEPPTSWPAWAARSGRT